MLGFWCADALVDREGLLNVCGTLATISFLDVASSDCLKCLCFLDWCLDAAGDAECLREVAAGFAICRGHQQEFSQIDQCTSLAVPVA